VAGIHLFAVILAASELAPESIGRAGIHLYALTIGKVVGNNTDGNRFRIKNFGNDGESEKIA